ncbi:spoIIIJ-associated protein [Actinomyces ruminicola]|uniref:SpoIIIJ-associated protein n=1 Tax=Actinomyces ruminicola TaxID=332524 RepID=A0A1H0APK3_9ACTO|nr:R3H domain-containing nucleic acid-binding protein [Actinomyces ruminicola]SDN35480.1 spoIIIJ-associated protein [Actinomyces ruminicola]
MSEHATQSQRPKHQAISVKDLEEEGEIGADYLEEFLDIVDLGGDIDIDVDHGRASVAVIASEEGDERELADLVGRDGEVLEAIQELTRLAVQARTGNRSRLMLDINGYRAGRRAELTKIAEEAVTKVKATGEAVALEPMNPFERKVCHDVVAAAGLFSESEGTEPHRHVVVMLPDDVDDVDDIDSDVDTAADSAEEIDSAEAGAEAAAQTTQAEQA